MEPAQLASQWSCCYLAALNDVFHCVLLSLVGKCLPDFVSSWRNSKYLFFCRLRIEEKMGTSHFWLCFLASLCCFLFLFHSFPMSPFAELWEAAGGGELLEAPECCNSTYQRREENPNRGTFLRSGEIAHPFQLHIPRSTRRVHYPLYAQSGRLVCLPPAGTGQAQENGSCDQGMHAQLLGLGVPCPQQL